MFTAVPASSKSSASEKDMPHGVVSSSVAMPSITTRSLPTVGSRKLKPGLLFPYSRLRRCCNDDAVDGHATSIAGTAAAEEEEEEVDEDVDDDGDDGDVGETLSFSSGMARIVAAADGNREVIPIADGCASS